MATTQTNPGTETTPQGGVKTLEVSKTVFDLDSKEYVNLKKQGPFNPVSTMEEFTTRLANDAKLILEIVNDGLEEYQRKQLATDNSVAWKLVEEDDEGKETLTDFTGTPISAEKSKSLSATVINLAKTIFGYSKNMVPGNVEENRKAKKAAKDQALSMLLSNPAAIEGLKK
jgi:hypothetical protein